MNNDAVVQRVLAALEGKSVTAYGAKNVLTRKATIEIGGYTVAVERTTFRYRGNVTEERLTASASIGDARAEIFRAEASNGKWRIVNNTRLAEVLFSALHVKGGA